MGIFLLNYKKIPECPIADMLGEPEIYLIE